MFLVVSQTRIWKHGRVKRRRRERAGERLPKLGDIGGVFKFLFFQTGYKTEGAGWWLPV